MLTFGDWGDEDLQNAGLKLPIGVEYQGFFLYKERQEFNHVADFALACLRRGRGVGDDEQERFFIEAMIHLLGSRDRHVACGLYWRWRLTENCFKILCEETKVRFENYFAAGCALLCPPADVKPNTLSQWVVRLLNERRSTIKGAEIVDGERGALLVPAPYLVDLPNGWQRKLETAHQRLARESEKERASWPKPPNPFIPIDETE